MEKCSIKFHIANLNENHYESIRIMKMQKSDNTKCWWVCGATGALIAGGNVVLQLLAKTVPVLYKTKHSLAMWFRNHVPRYLPKYTNDYIQSLCLVALHIVAKNWRQAKCTS